MQKINKLDAALLVVIVNVSVYMWPRLIVGKIGVVDDGS
jgi:hypothetical protein